MSSSLRFLAAFVVYAVIDMAWNMSPPAVAMYASLHEASGNDWSFGKPMDTWGGVELVAVLVFFRADRARKQPLRDRTGDPRAEPPARR